MKRKMIPGILLTLALAWNTFAAENLLLSHADKQGVPEGKKTSQGTTTTVRNAKINITFEKPGALEYTIPLTSSIGERLILTGQLRTENLVKNSQDWQDARVHGRFLKKDWKIVGRSPRSITGIGTESKNIHQIYLIPKDAHMLKIEAAHFGKSGKAVFTDLILQASPENLLIAPNPDGIPEEGIRAGGFSAKVQQGNVHFTINGNANRIFRIPVLPSWKSLILSMKVRTKDVRRGKAEWQDARMAVRFYGKKGPVGAYPVSFHFTGTVKDQKCVREYDIPAGATYLEIAPSNFGVSGSVEFHEVTLTPGEKVPDFSWDRPFTEQNALRERLCLNGLWQARPVENPKADALPPSAAEKGWVSIKVPYTWECAVLREPDGKKSRAKKWHTAWYYRTFQTPRFHPEKERIHLELQHIQTHGKVFVDGTFCGEIEFPGGTLNLTKYLTSGKKQELAIQVSAIPKTQDELIIMDINNIYKVAAKVQNKGICGDVFLHKVARQRIENTHFITSVEKKQIAFDCELSGLLPNRTYQLSAIVKDTAGKTAGTWTSPAFTQKDLRNGRYTFRAAWNHPKLWDIDTPENIYTGILTLSSGGKKLDETLPEQFGFREFRIDGQNYVLNGKTIHLLAYPLGNYSDFWSVDNGSREFSERTLKRMKNLGFNFAISSNYNFMEGRTHYIRGFFEAADKVGYLHSCTLPHPRNFGENMLKNPEQRERCRKITEYLIKRYWNHPSLVMYATTHNCTGAWGDQNPIRLGGDYVRASAGGEREKKEHNRAAAQCVREMIESLDREHPVYVHASGSLFGQYTLNMYLNWAPLQERSDWLEHFSKKGKMPLALVEWGPPHSASFSSFRGWVWSRAHVQTAWDAEYISAYFGDQAAEWTPERLPLLDRIIKGDGKEIKFSSLCVFEKFSTTKQIQAHFFADNYRSMRAWNLSLMLPWDYSSNYDPVPGDYPSKPWPKSMEHLNRPGLVPERTGHGSYPHTAYPEAYKLSPLGEAIRYWGAPQIAFLGGKDVFTSKEHIYEAGETVGKTLVILNDKRHEVSCRYEVSLDGVSAEKVSGECRIAPGGRAFEKISIRLPENAAGKNPILFASVKFSDGTVREDRFPIQVIASSPARPEFSPLPALYDPKGETEALLKKMGIPYRTVQPTEIPRQGILIIGRRALSGKEGGLNLDAVRNGLQVLVMEQDSNVLNRLGFRINEMGMRKLFFRDSRNSLLNGMKEVFFSDWRGSSTLLRPMLDYQDFFCPPWTWCGFKQHRVWRCGNRGTVADVLIEKPTVGNFFPVLDCGFLLQYAPLLEYREGKGRILFSQLEITGRTEREPIAERMLFNMLKQLSTPVPEAKAKLKILGGNEFKEFIRKLGFRESEKDNANVLAIGPGADCGRDLRDAVKNGMKVLCFGLNGKELNLLFPGLFKGRDEKGMHSIPADLTAPEFAGISNLDTYFQTRLPFTTVNGRELSVLRYGKGSIVLCGVPAYQLDAKKYFHLRTAFRRRSAMTAQLIRNAGVSADSVLLERFRKSAGETPWLNSYYIQTPIDEDNPYRYYHW